MMNQRSGRKDGYIDMICDDKTRQNDFYYVRHSSLKPSVKPIRDIKQYHWFEYVW